MINNVPCRFCASNDTKALYPTFDIFGNNFEIHNCSICRAYFLGSHPTKAILDKAYDSTYYGEKDEKFLPIIENVLDYFRWRRAKRVSRYLKNGSKILDIGCGNGRFLSSLLKFGNFELYGTEMDGNSAKRAMRINDIHLKIGSLSENDFDGTYFDAITMYQVFEHLTEPKQMLETIQKKLKNNGIFVVSFPNISSLQSKIFKGKWFHLDPPRHLLFFDPNDFSSLMEKYNFKLVKINYISTEQNPYGMIQSMLNIFNKKREILFESFKSNKIYIRDVSKMNMFFQNIFFIISFPIFILTDLFSGLLKNGATVEFIFKKYSD